jgi:hypothetical protein
MVESDLFISSDILFHEHHKAIIKVVGLYLDVAAWLVIGEVQQRTHDVLPMALSHHEVV